MNVIITDYLHEEHHCERSFSLEFSGFFLKVLPCQIDIYNHNM